MKRTGFKPGPRKPLRKKRPGCPKGKAWTFFSRYIRQRGADENGINTCISCGARKHWTELQAGHFIPKSLGLSIYFDERNVHPQCSTCNLTWQGNILPYAAALKEKYGEGIIEELKAQQRQITKMGKHDFYEIFEKYKALVK